MNNRDSWSEGDLDRKLIRIVRRWVDEHMGDAERAAARAQASALFDTNSAIPVAQARVGESVPPGYEPGAEVMAPLDLPTRERQQQQETEPENRWRLRVSEGMAMTNYGG